MFQVLEAKAYIGVINKSVLRECSNLRSGVLFFGEETRLAEEKNASSLA